MKRVLIAMRLHLVQRQHVNEHCVHCLIRACHFFESLAFSMIAVAVCALSSLNKTMWALLK